jgi:hypothetical protein
MVLFPHPFMPLPSPRFKFPFWQFLNQPVFQSSYTPVLNPRRFWYLYQIELLERCLEKDCESSGYRDL